MIDWTDAFDNSRYVPGAEHLPEQWARAAQAFRETCDTPMERNLAYGAQPRERLDLFHPCSASPSRGVVVIVHGGYWHLLGKDFFSHLAAGAMQQGWSVALPSYPLAPQAAIADITRSIARAVSYIADIAAGPLRLLGHSAGGHLVSRMACQGLLPASVTDRIAHIVSVSGLHALEPLALTAMNATLQLSREEAIAESPALLRPHPHLPTTFWVGAQERPELLRQTRLIEEAWAKKGARVQAYFAPGENHFSVIEALQNPHSPLVQALLQQGGSQA